MYKGTPECLEGRRGARRMGGDDMSAKQGWREIEEAQAVQRKREGRREGGREVGREGGREGGRERGGRLEMGDGPNVPNELTFVAATCLLGVT